MSSIFDSFKSALKGDIVSPTDLDYSESIIRWAKNAERQAKFVVFVKDAEDVALAIKYATAEKLQFAIRGGGHSVSGASSSEGGLVIDLSRYLNGVKVDPDNKIGYIGGGCTWEIVDRETIKYGLAAVGGTVNHVCVMSLYLYTSD